MTLAEHGVFASAKIVVMAKRTIKPAAGESRVSLHEAASAARLVHRDADGRFVIVEQDHGRSRERHRTDNVGQFKDVVRREKSHLASSRGSSKKR
jgi:hypothetical protein